MKFKFFIYFSILFILFSMNGCSPTSTKDYQTLAGSQMKQLTLLLKKVQDPTDLKKMQKKIKIQFNKLGKTMIEYRSFLDKHPEVLNVRSEKLNQIAFDLKCELLRIYDLDGGRSIIEMAQKEIYIKLSLFENSLTQEKIDLFKSTKPISKGLN